MTYSGVEKEERKKNLDEIQRIARKRQKNIWRETKMSRN